MAKCAGECKVQYTKIVGSGSFAGGKIVPEITDDARARAAAKWLAANPNSPDYPRIAEGYKKVRARMMKVSEPSAEDLIGQAPFDGVNLPVQKPGPLPGGRLNPGVVPTANFNALMTERKKRRFKAPCIRGCR